MTVRFLVGDVFDRLAELPAESVHCVVCSPPYWRQRDYGHLHQIGLEDTPEEYVSALVSAFRTMRRVLVANAAVWVNLGEKWAAGGNGGGGSCMAKRRDEAWAHARGARGWRKPPPGYKNKDMVGAPWMAALALRADGWWLRQVVIWDKSVAIEPPRRDRPSLSHEYLFQFSKGETPRTINPGEPWFFTSVWTIRPQPRAVDHPALMPTELARRCVVSSTSPGETVLDCFAGAGTTGLVADRLGRNAILIELVPDYMAMARQRILGDAPLFAEAAE